MPYFNFCSFAYCTVPVPIGQQYCGRHRPDHKIEVPGYD